EYAAQSLLNEWLAAQNTGDLAAYELLYGEKFHGVRRSKERVLRFDRASWLDDRRRMFKKPMTVKASGISFVHEPNAIRLQFTQAFVQGTYADVGEKEIVVVREKGDIRIAYEEMLASHPLSKDLPTDSASVGSKYGPDDAGPDSSPCSSPACFEG